MWHVEIIIIVMNNNTKVIVIVEIVISRPNTEYLQCLRYQFPHRMQIISVNPSETSGS